MAFAIQRARNVSAHDAEIHLPKPANALPKPARHQPTTRHSPAKNLPQPAAAGIQ